MARRKNTFTGQVSDLDLRLIRVFKTVVECGGLSSAQTVLNVSCSTISKQLSDLETRIGMRLCNRGRSGFYLTQQGLQFLTYAKELLKATEEFRKNVSNISDRLVGQIEIGIIDNSISDQHCPLILAIKKYKELAPGISANLTIGTPGEIERGVIDGRLHIGIIPDYQRLAGLQYSRIYDEEVGLYCGGEHPIAQAIRSGKTLHEEEIYEHALVYRGYYESEKVRDRKQKFPLGSTAFQTEAVLALVKSGVFLGFYPTHCNNSLDGENLEILPDIFRYKAPICMVYRSNRKNSTILQDFIELLNTHVI